MSLGKEGTILIIEDDEGVARLQQRRLERAGYHATCAGTAQEAMARIQVGGVRLVLLDYRLPGSGTGLDVYAELKRSGYDCPVIMVTGFSDEATVIKALRLGVRDFVTKSAEYLDYLPEAVERVLKQLHTESQLAQSTERLAAIINSAMDAIITMDHEGNISEFNPAAEKTFGHCRADVIGRSLAELIIPSAWRGHHHEGLARFLRTGEGRVLGKRLEMAALRADGSEFPVELTVTRSGLEGPPTFTGYLRDITERKQAEAKIREQASLLDQSNDAILVRDLQDRILFWSRGAERLYGWAAAEALGRHTSELFFRAPQPELQEARAAVIEAGEWFGELRQVNKDGKEIMVASRWTLMRDEQAQPKSTLVINTDVTQKKKLEAQFLRAQRMESIGTLAGGIAHDLNNVLTPILMAVELLQTILPTAHQALLVSLRTSAERGAEMVKQILSFARGVEGKRIHLQLKHVIRDTEKMLRHSLPKSIELHADVPNDLWVISGDATQLSQVLMNLCVNARDAMPEGGQLRLRAENKTLDESYALMHPQAKPGPHVLLQIVDTDTGIAPEILDKVFDPFFTTKEPGKGTGLGLSTTLGIVRSHGGFISVDSTVGRGSEFSIYLPAIDAVRVKQADEAPRLLPCGRGELVLVADDEASIREITKVTLEAHCYRVLVAADGTEAVALYAKHGQAIQAVLTDMQMPVMDGLATAKALHRLDPLVQIIAVSGVAASSGRDEKAGWGFRAFLPKPYTAADLLTTLRDVLDRGRALDSEGKASARETTRRLTAPVGTP